MVAATQIEIPAFDFTAFYYADILEALIEFKRLNVPELTNESPQEPLIQVLRAFALVGHLNNTLTDLVANECTLPTAQLVETVRNMLRLIDFEMRSAQPAQVDIVYELAQVIFSAVEAISVDAQAATIASAGEAARFFEADAALIVTPTNKLSSCQGMEDSGNGVLLPENRVFTDFTAEANDPSLGQDFAPWSTPFGGVGTDLDTLPNPTEGREGDFMLFGHTEAMFDQVDIDLLNPMSDIIGVWEYYDGNYRKAQPNSVTNNGASLTLDLTDYLGTTKLTGTPIRVVHDPSGAFEDVFSDWDGAKNVVKTRTLLGQSTPSTTTTDYTVGSAWERFSTIVDNTLSMAVSDKIETALPQTITENWSLGEFGGVTAFWMRFRIVEVLGGPIVPDITEIQIDEGKQYLKRLAVQGRTQSETLGSSDGTASQEFLASKTDYLDGSAEVTVSGVTWTRVDNFLASKPTDRHYRVELATDDRAKVIFGDGVEGAIPPTGVNNITIAYRYNAADDGNVGANTVRNDKTGLSLVNKLWNPRPAAGWEAAQGSDDASLARAKIEGPASLRTRDVALGPDDAETLATRASVIDAESDNPGGVIKMSRAKAIEEGFGPKTVELVVVAAGAELLTQDQLDAISEFYNGNQFVTPVRPKRFVANQEVTAVNYAQRAIDITATAYAGGAVTALQIKNALIALLQPEARKEDGVTFEWDFGGRVPASRLVHEIFSVDETIVEVDITVPVPSADILLQPRELPVAGVIQITVLPPQ
jgi:hypothetical protein